MSKKLIIVICVICLALVGGCIFWLRSRETTGVVNDENTSTNIGIPKDEAEEIVSSLFTELLSSFADEPLEDYRIDSIKVEDRGGELEEYYPNPSNNAIFATVTYSVKPFGDLEYSIWFTEEGEQDGEWIVNRVSRVYVDKVNDVYEIISHEISFNTEEFGDVDE